MSLIYTIGHSNHSMITFCKMLTDHNIQCVVDIRSVPYSKYYSQFNQSSISKYLTEQNIRYVFLGDALGGRITDLSCYTNNQIPTVKVGYATYLNYDIINTKKWFNTGIEKLLGFCEEVICAIMCSEENPEKCHRELIVGRRLREMGYSVVHIRSNQVKKDQFELF